MIHARIVKTADNVVNICGKSSLEKKSGDSGKPTNDGPLAETTLQLTQLTKLTQRLVTAEPLLATCLEGKPNDSSG
jgi:hypothetical protein